MRLAAVRDQDGIQRFAPAMVIVELLFGIKYARARSQSSPMIGIFSVEQNVGNGYA